MCGFAGVLLRAAQVPDHERVLAMGVALRHRGPDHQAAWTAPHAGLAHARLSIIDLSPSGHQPMTSASGRTVIAFNGEIYNFRELRAALAQEGATFRSASDTEVLVEGLERHGPSFLSRLRGMFAFAAWDTHARTLLLARDPFGIKPLYHAVDADGTLRFGSEIKALLAYGPFSKRIDHQALSEFLWFGNATGDGTHFAGVRRLPPGAYAVVRPGDTTIVPTRYWRLEDVAPIADDEAAAVRTVGTLLEDAVRSHLVADVPVGVFLSGGIDSSAITAHASRLSGTRIATYAVGFDYAGGVNELPRAARVAARFGTEHHELQVSAGALPDLLAALVSAHDEPFADAANIPLWLLCRELRGGIKVVLQGDGGDEVFAGYRRYNVAGWEWAWHPAARALAPVVAGLPAGPRQRRLARFLRAMAAPAAERTALLLTVDTPLDPPTRLLTAAARARLAETAPFAMHEATAARFATLDTVQRTLHTDLALLLPTQFLEKVDKSTMAHGIEVRVPFLDLPLATYGAGLPSSMKVRALQKKYVLRRALRGVVPDEVLDGPKTGFGVPYGTWLRTTAGDLLADALAAPAVRDLGLIDEGEVRRRLAQHRAGTHDHGFMLWKLLQLALWLVEHAPDA